MTPTLVPEPPIAEQVPYSLRATIETLLFTTHAWPVPKCDRMLTCILRYARVEQFALEHNERYATITIHNLLKTYHLDKHMQETCCYQTLHTFVRLLCALGILKKQASSNQPTTYLFPLDPAYRFYASSAILSAIDRLRDPNHTKNPKMRKKAQEVLLRLVIMNPTLPSEMRVEIPAFPGAAHQTLPQRIRKMVDSLGLSPSIGIALFQGITELCLNALHPESIQRVFPCNDRGDSLAQETVQESPHMALLGDSTSNTPGTESTNITWPGDSPLRFPGQASTFFEYGRQVESTGKSGNLPNSSSSIESSPIDTNSIRKELVLEAKPDEEWSGSDGQLSQEALRYLRLLDGPEYATPDYLTTHAGKMALGGYKKKIRRNPRLARIAAINTLIQCTFYDLSRQKSPLENAGSWFHSSFERYADQNRPMEILGEILDWAKSPYTLEEIASVLPQERKRQETQWWPPESLHRPFSSCIGIYHHLQNGADEKGRSQNVPLEAIWQNAEMRSGVHTDQLMNDIEAEKLAHEISREASWYLDDIRFCRAPQFEENAYVVQASIAHTSFPVTYTSRQNWLQEHQEQVRHRVREEQRGGFYATH